MMMIIIMIMTIMDMDAGEGDDADLFQVQGMWHIQVVKDTATCLDRVPPFTHSQITGADADADEHMS